MPIYVYECVKCAHNFETVQKVGEGNESLNCPKCGEPRPKKLVTTFKTHTWSEFIDKMEKRINPQKFK